MPHKPSAVSGVSGNTLMPLGRFSRLGWRPTQWVWGFVWQSDSRLNTFPWPARPLRQLHPPALSYDETLDNLFICPALIDGKSMPMQRQAGDKSLFDSAKAEVKTKVPLLINALPCCLDHPAQPWSRQLASGCSRDCASQEPGLPSPASCGLRWEGLEGL